jgi:hypothetical protein
MNSGTNVVVKARHRQFRRSRSAAYSVARFQDTDRVTRSCDFNGCGKPVRAGADNDRIEFHVY